MGTVMDDKQAIGIGTTLTIHHGQANTLMFKDFGGGGVHVAIFGNYETKSVMIGPADVDRLIEYLCTLPSGETPKMKLYAADLCEREGIAGPMMKAVERRVLKSAAAILRRVVADKGTKWKQGGVKRRALNR